MSRNQVPCCMLAYPNVLPDRPLSVEGVWRFKHDATTLCGSGHKVTATQSLTGAASAVTTKPTNGIRDRMCVSLEVWL